MLFSVYICDKYFGQKVKNVINDVSFASSTPLTVTKVFFFESLHFNIIQNKYDND